MKPIIRVENLSKQYRIGAQQASYGTLRDSLTNAVTAPFRRFNQTRNQKPETRNPETIWALKNISFEIFPGEAVGIIGRNGAGKSTLLKILSRITEPTTGCVDLFGRVASLLEVGTGFHPELTGRENIYLNGAILGMKRIEIARYFDDIVGFAEVEKFIDTSVKHYSSGMYLRLAFAVAAHLDPEILLVDEVLAVGDASFQRKCLNKMREVGAQGRTVLFVSHNMAAITRLCERAILLDAGGVVSDGSAQQTITKYLRSGFGSTAIRAWEDLDKAPGNAVARLCGVRVVTEMARVSESIDIRKPVGIEMEFEVRTPGYVLIPNFHFYNEEGVCIFVVNDSASEWRRKPRPSGRYVSTVWIPGNFLSEGTLIVDAALSTMDPVIVHYHEKDAVAFQVIDSLDGGSVRGDYAGPIPGVIRPKLQWTTTCYRPKKESYGHTNL